MYRVTGSRFYSVTVISFEPSSKLKTFFYSSFSSPALEHGKKSESFVRSLYVRSLYLQTMSEKGFQGIFVEETGLKNSSKFSFLVASLYGLVHCNGEKWGLEIKCPYSKSSLSSALEDKKFFLKKGKVVSLKKSHPYFYRIQGQMYSTGLKRIDLVVWFGSYEPLFIQSVPYDDSFMDQSVLPKLKFFYCCAILPEFFTKPVKRGLKLYLQGGLGNYDAKE